MSHPKKTSKKNWNSIPFFMLDSSEESQSSADEELNDTPVIPSSAQSVRTPPPSAPDLENHPIIISDDEPDDQLASLPDPLSDSTVPPDDPQWNISSSTTTTTTRSFVPSVPQSQNVLSSLRASSEPIAPAPALPTPPPQPQLENQLDDDDPPPPIVQKKRRRSTKSTDDKLVGMEDAAMKNYSFKCCTQLCLWHIPFLIILKLHQWAKKQSHHELTVFINQKTKGNNNIQVEGYQVCIKGFMHAYGISNNKYYRALRLPERTIPVHGNTGSGLRNIETLSTKRTQDESTIAWLSNYFNGIACSSPTEEGELHLPSYINRESMFTCYKNDMLEKNISAVEISSTDKFNKIISAHFSHVKFLKKTRLGRCSFALPSLQGKQTAPTDRKKNNSKRKWMFTRNWCRLKSLLWKKER